MAELADALIGVKFRAGDTVLMESRTGLLVEKLARPEVEELVLEEVPDVTYADVGGLDDQIEAITDAVELPYLYRELYAEHRLPAPRASCSTARPDAARPSSPRRWPTRWPRRWPRSTGNTNARSYFLNIKGPELLNKYVGETERQIRLVFQRAREKSEEGVPVIVFFDEMDSLFRTRGTGISSDMESTIVPQLLAEIDGVETLKDVIVIGASNREDLIDPAILRPGRLDVKIRIERPNEVAAAQIFARYLTPDLPLDADEVRTLGGGDPAKATQAMIEATVAEMYRDDEDNRFLEVTYQSGDKETLYYRDFSSGAMIENIVRRAKKLAIKRAIADGRPAGSAPTTFSSRSARSTRRTRTCPTPPTRTTGPRSPERRASASSTSAPSSATTRRPRAAAPSSGWAPVSTSERGARDRVGSRGHPQGLRNRDRVRHPCPAAATPTPSPPPRCSSTPTPMTWPVSRRAGTSRTRLRATTPADSPTREPMPPQVETHLVNTVLTNGARFYVDHAHPEYSTPECPDALSASATTAAGELV